MTWLVAERTGDVEAPPERCFAALADVERWPEWQDFTKTVRVLERGEDGRASVVETEAATPFRALRYVMRYAWEEPGRLSWEQVESDLKHVQGEWRFEPLTEGTRTRATLLVEGDPGRWARFLRGPLYEQTRDWLLGRALDELRARVAVDGAG